MITEKNTSVLNTLKTSNNTKLSKYSSQSLQFDSINTLRKWIATIFRNATNLIKPDLSFITVYHFETNIWWTFWKHNISFWFEKADRRLNDFTLCSSSSRRFTRSHHRPLARPPRNIEKHWNDIQKQLQIMSQLHFRIRSTKADILKKQLFIVVR